MKNRPRQERWTRTRARLMDASVKSLVEHGYGGTTMQGVQDIAGVSRGALAHHFSSMNALLVEAIHHVAEGQLAELGEAVESLSANTKPEMVRLLHKFMSGPLFLAGLELWFASRTNPVLREALLPAERKVGEAIRQLFSKRTNRGSSVHLKAGDLAELLALLRGLAITGLLRSDAGFESQILENWIARITSTR